MTDTHPRCQRLSVFLITFPTFSHSVDLWNEICSFFIPFVSHFSALTSQTFCFSICLISSTAALAVLIQKIYEEQLNKIQEFKWIKQKKICHLPCQPIIMCNIGFGNNHDKIYCSDYIKRCDVTLSITQVRDMYRIILISVDKTSDTNKEETTRLPKKATL